MIQIPRVNGRIDIDKLKNKIFNIKIVEHFGDIKVELVKHFGDIKVETTAFSGFGQTIRVQVVPHFGDIKVELVNHFGDAKVKLV